MAKFEIRENEGKIGVRKVGNVLLKQGQWPRHGQCAPHRQMWQAVLGG